MIIAVFEVLLICGLPFGEYTMGGQNRVLPLPYRLFAASSILAQVFGAAMILQGGGFMKLWFSHGATKIICFVFAGFFLLNTFLNAISKSKKEKFAMTPAALIEAICFAVTAFGM